MNILIIIPAYNEENNIEKLLKELKRYCHEVSILVINDGSRDHTSKVVRQEKVNIIDLPCNLGIGGAVQTGYKYARQHNFDIAIQIDGDGQHDPSYIHYFIQPLLKNEADLVIGSRYIDRIGFQSSFVRRIGIFYFSKLIFYLQKKL